LRRTACTSVVLAAVGVALAGCGDVKSQLGLERRAPDEFAVVRHAPLAVPPDYRLRPPVPGTRRPQEQTTSAQARAVLVDGVQGAGVAAQTTSGDRGGLTPGESALLRHAGTDTANPNIRVLVNSESAILATDNRTFVEKLMFWREQPLPGEAVDPSREQQRIQQNAALGNPIDKGTTPTIERKSSGRGLNIF